MAWARGLRVVAMTRVALARVPERKGGACGVVSARQVGPPASRCPAQIGRRRVSSWAARLVGERDPIAGWPPPAAAGPDCELATVTAVIPEAPDTVTLRLARGRTKGFLPGQHFIVQVPTGGRFPSLESYSVASSPWPDPTSIDLTVKEVPGGRVSPVLVRRIPVGAVLEIEGPFGHFTWDEDDGGPLALVGAGSGVVPLVAIVRYAAAKGLQVPIRMLCSATDREHAIYFDLLSDLSDAHHWLEVTHTFTRDRHDTAARYHRRIDTAMLDESFAQIAAGCLAYVCGPFDMVRTVETGMASIGVAATRTNTEQWE
jgi:ferredoxin-NADP reductase